MANLFEKAKAVPATKAKSKGKAKHEADIASLHEFAALKAAEKTIATMLETMQAEINVASLDEFINKGNAESYNGVDGMTVASMQLRKRSARSALSDQEKLVLEGLGIDIEKSADSRFYINNKYSEDSELLEKVSAALEGIVPDDFLGHTGEKYVTTGNSINDAFRKCDEDQLNDVLPIVGVQATRAKFGGSHDEMLKILDRILKS